jgi:hypothetical protein
MKTYLATSWLFIVRTWLYLPGEFIDLIGNESSRYAAQIEVTEDGKFRVLDGFFLQLTRTNLFRPGEPCQLTSEEAARYSDRIEELSPQEAVDAVL